MTDITIYHFSPSAPSRTAVLAARVLGIDINIEEINLFAKEQLKPDFVKINPQHCVPTLEDNGFVLWESRAIATYMCQAYGGAKGAQMYPHTHKEKAIVDQRLYFDAGTLYPRIRAICFPVLFQGETKVSKEKRDSLDEAFGFLEMFLTKSTWVAGNTMTVADCSCVTSVTSIQAVGYDLDPYPNVVAWLEACKENMPGFDENLKGAEAFGDAVKSKMEPGQFSLPSQVLID